MEEHDAPAELYVRYGIYSQVYLKNLGSDLLSDPNFLVKTLHLIKLK